MNALDELQNAKLTDAQRVYFLTSLATTLDEKGSIDSAGWSNSIEDTLRWLA